MILFEIVLPLGEVVRPLVNRRAKMRTRLHRGGQLVAYGARLIKHDGGMLFDAENADEADV